MGKPSDTLLLLPPGVLLAGEGLCEAVHGLAGGDGDRGVLGLVVVLPRGDEEQVAIGAEAEAVLRGVVAVGEPVVGDEGYGETAPEGFVDDGLFAFGDAGADEDAAAGRLCEAA